LVREFGPELEALGERVEEITDRLETLDKQLTTRLRAMAQVLGGLSPELAAQFKVKPRPYVAIALDFGYEAGFLSTQAAEVGALEFTEDLYAAHQARLTVLGLIRGRPVSRVSYWEESNDNPFHGKGRNRHGIDEGWVKGHTGRLDWVLGRHYAGELFSERTVGLLAPKYVEREPRALGQGLLYYTPVALPGLSLKWRVGSAELAALFQSGQAVDGNLDALDMSVAANAGKVQMITPRGADDFLLLRGAVNWGDVTLGATYLQSGLGEARGYSIDAHVQVLGRRLEAEFAQLTDAVAGADPGGNDTAFVVAVPNFLDLGWLSVGAKYGEVEPNFQPGSSILQIPYLLVAGNAPFDRPLFLEGNRKGYEITVGLRLWDVPLDLRYYDLQASVDTTDPEPVILVTLMQRLATRLHASLSYGFQGDDLQVARAYVSLGW